MLTAVFASGHQRHGIGDQSQVFKFTQKVFGKELNVVILVESCGVVRPVDDWQRDIKVRLGTF
jgi:hypothetical protein